MKKILPVSRLSRKMLRYLIPLVSIPIIVIIIISIVILNNASDEARIKTLEQTTSSIKQDMAEKIQIRSQLYDTIFKNMIIDLERLKEQIALDGCDKRMLDDYFFTNNLVSAVYYISPSGNTMIKSPLSNFKQNSVIEYWDDPGYSQFLPDANPYHIGGWMVPHKDLKGLGNTISYAIPIIINNTFGGLVAIDITLDALFNKIVHIDPTVSSYVFLIGNDGSIVTSSDNIFDDLQISKSEKPNILDSELLKRENYLDWFMNHGEMEEIISLPIKQNTEEKFMALASIPSLGGKLVLVSPMGEIIQRQAEEAHEIEMILLQVGIGSMILVIIITILLSFWWTQRAIISPILILQENASNIASLKDYRPIRVKRNDEIGNLVTAFNKMVSDLKGSRVELERSNINLEKKVKQKTRQLEKKVEELENFNRIVVGRELKMIELKKKIKFCEENKSRKEHE